MSSQSNQHDNSAIDPAFEALLRRAATLHDLAPEQNRRIRARLGLDAPTGAVTPTVSVAVPLATTPTLPASNTPPASIPRARSTRRQWLDIALGSAALVLVALALAAVFRGVGGDEPQSPGVGASPEATHSLIAPPTETIAPEPIDPTPAMDPILTHTSWDLVSLNGDPLAGWAASLIFEPWGVRGGAVCGTFWSTNSLLRDGSVRIEDLIHSGIGCPSGLEDREAVRLQFAQILTDATSYSFDGAQLILGTADGRILRFTLSGEDLGSLHPDFMGTQWRLVSFNGEPLPQEASITLGFGVGSTLLCNGYGFEADMSRDDAISIRVGAMTNMSCATEMMSLEEASDLTDRYVRALSAVTRYLRDGDQLHLTTDDGRELEFIIIANVPNTAGAGIPLPPNVGAVPSSGVTVELFATDEPPRITLAEAMQVVVAEFPWGLGGDWQGQQVTIDSWYGLATIEGFADTEIADQSMWILDYGNVQGIISSRDPSDNEPRQINNHNVYAVDTETLELLFLGSYADEQAPIEEPGQTALPTPDADGTYRGVTAEEAQRLTPFHLVMPVFIPEGLEPAEFALTSPPSMVIGGERQPPDMAMAFFQITGSEPRRSIQYDQRVGSGNVGGDVETTIVSIGDRLVNRTSTSNTDNATVVGYWWNWDDVFRQVVVVVDEPETEDLLRQLVEAIIESENLAVWMRDHVRLITDAGAWKLTVTELDDSAGAGVSYGWESAADITAYADAVRALGLQAFTNHETVPVTITFRQPVTFEYANALLQQSGAQALSAKVRTFPANGGLGTTGSRANEDGTLAPQAGWQPRIVGAEGIFEIEAVIDREAWDVLSNDPFVFLVDVMRAIAVDELAEHGITNIPMDNISISGPYGWMESYGMVPPEG